MATVSQFEIIFTTLHGSSSLSFEHGIIANLCNVLQAKFSHIRKEVIKIYAMTRISIRIKYLNSTLKSDAIKRKQQKKNKKFK